MTVKPLINIGILFKVYCLSIALAVFPSQTIINKLVISAYI